MGYEDAVRDFRAARRRANLEQLLARLTGKQADLLSYDQVRRQLGAAAGLEIGLHDVPLSSIVGSVGRYGDFTRSFLPKAAIAKERWARVQLASDDLLGLPAIEVYKIGEAYFVRDGNHRVSVARQLGASHIEAYVTEIHTRVPVTADIQADDLILKAEYAEFIQAIRLDELCPGADLEVTAPGKYPELREHINVHRYFMGLDLRRDVSMEEAVVHWYNEVYLPVVRAIREQEILADFPGRTVTDLYLWTSEHRAELEEELGWHVGTERAVLDLAHKFSPTVQRRLARVAEKALEVLTPATLEDGPPAGMWRKERQLANPNDRIFHDILVPVTGHPAGWSAVEQAVELANQEGARLMGLHVVGADSDRDGEAALAVHAQFERRCQLLGVEGELALEAGPVARTICKRSRWADVLVVTMRYPPVPHRFLRLGSGFRALVRCSATPLLAVPDEKSKLQRPLLAYDGSAKAREALYVAAYLTMRTERPLVVVNVREDGLVSSDLLAEVRAYLESRGASTPCTYIEETGPVAAALLRASREHGCDVILMGGYRRPPVLEVLFGSTVDQVLRQCEQPVLICR